MRWLAGLALVLLVACGADGAPEPVGPEAPVTSEVRIGVTGEL